MDIPAAVLPTAAPKPVTDTMDPADALAKAKAEKKKLKKTKTRDKRVWGKPGFDDLMASETRLKALDSNDPNYSDEDGDIEVSAVVEATVSSITSTTTPEFFAYEEDLDQSTYISTNVLEEINARILKESVEARSGLPADRLFKFKQNVLVAAQEYLSALDKAEFVRCVEEMDFRLALPHVPKIIIQLFLDVAEAKKLDLVSLVEYCLEKKVFSVAQLIHGLRLLVHRIDDLVLDVPDAKDQLASFIQMSLLRGLFLQDQVTPLQDVLALSPSQIKSFKFTLDRVLSEYLSAEDLHEVRLALASASLPELHYEVVKRSISLALDRKNKDKELVSILIASLSGSDIPREQVALGFESLLVRMDDLLADVPSALADLSAFLARAISDEALPPSFLSTVNLMSTDLGQQVINNASVLLSASLGNPTRLMRIWGLHSNRPVAELKEEVVTVLKELYTSGDVSEALRCIRELNSVYFLHEVVRKAFLVALDGNFSSLQPLFQQFVKSLFDVYAPTNRIFSGFKRVFLELPDITLDAPSAPTIFKACVQKALEDGVLTVEQSAELLS